MKKTLLLILLLSFVFLGLISCFSYKEMQNFEMATEEFSQYHNGKNEVAVLSYSSLCFEGYEINLDALFPDEDFNGGLLIKDNKFYFSTSTAINTWTPAPSEYTLNIYESDFGGKEISLVFSKQYDTLPRTYAKEDSFYIEYRSSSDHFFWEEERNIDKFTLSTTKYENIASEKDCDLSEYHSTESGRYEIEVERNSLPEKYGKFTITDTESGQVRTIDEDYLKNTIYIESMERFEYGPRRYNISNGHILLIYGIGIYSGLEEGFLIFEYDFDANEIEYKAFVMLEEDYYFMRAIYLDQSK